MCRTRPRWPELALLIVALSCGGGAAARQAPGCTTVGRVAPAADSTAVTEDVRAGRSYTCVLRAGEPPLRVELVPDTAANTIARIEVRRGGEVTPFQTLTEGQEEPPYRGAEWFAARDLDGDGRLDLLLLSGWGVTGNSFYNVWRWNPTAGRFVFDSTLSALSSPSRVAGRPCVTTRLNGGHAGNIYGAGTLCLERGKWVQVAGERQEWDRGIGAYLRTVYERRGDTLVVTRVDTVRDSTNR